VATLGRSQKMINPYEPPESDEGRGVERPDTERSKTGNAAPFVGCGVGGCLVPLLLFIACMVFLGDPGGPLLWPIIAVPLGVIGVVVGFVYRLVRRDVESHRDHRHQ